MSVAIDDQAKVPRRVYPAPLEVDPAIDDPVAADNEVALESLSQWQLARRRFRRHRMAMVGVVIFGGMMAVAALGPFLVPFETLNFPGLAGTRQAWSMSSAPTRTVATSSP